MGKVGNVLELSRSSNFKLCYLDSCSAGMTYPKD
jgi:hypothetical protein